MSSVWTTIVDELREAVRTAVPGGGVITFEIPPDPAMGDIAVPCFSLSKILKQAPGEIAGRMAEGLSAHPLVAKAEGVGGYCNITLAAGEVARRVFADRRAGFYTLPSERAGIKPAPTQTSEKPEDIVLEFVSPNSNKPLHLGHLRNAFFGEAVGRLLEYAGHRVHRVMLLNDRGIAMAKAMLAYARWGEGATPESEHIKGDHFVGGWYVQFDRKNKDENKDKDENEDDDTRRTPLEEDAQELVRKWEAGDEETRALWKRMCGWVIAGHAETYAMLGITFEKTYRESEIAERGRAIVADALARGVFTKDEKGNTIAPLKDRVGLDDKVVVRADGTTVYATQDLALVGAKAEDHPGARSIVVTGAEQDYYFKQLNAMVGMLTSLSREVSDEGSHTMGTSSHNSEILRLRSRTRSAQDELRETQPIEHLSYEMVHLPEGRMKSREGTVVDADDLLAKLEEMATAEIVARADMVPGEPDAGTDEPPVIVGADAPQRARDIALAAIRFYLLHANPRTVLTFNPKESLAFTGKTGPYLQYMHARMCAIMRRVGGVAATFRSPSGGGAPAHGDLKVAATQASLLTHPTEKQLLLRIARFPDVIAEAAAQRDPSHVAQFAYDFAQAFADFYRDCPVLNADTAELRDTRLALLDASKQTLAEALRLLGIAALEEM